MPESPKKQNPAPLLLKWYDRQKRDLPWRDNADPYRVWVSEIMLQQTQVATVIPYFDRWMDTFPTVRHLAESPLNTVLKHWEGLGYYTRARNLHKAAQQVVSDHAGHVPDHFEGLLALPGIGRYTAGAIASIAFDRAVPVLDGNVKRVFSRLYCLDENGATPKSENALWRVAESLVPPKRPGDFNQALMELGATVCLPKKPACAACPLKKICAAAAQGQQDRFPPPKPRAPSKKIEVSAAVIRRNGKVFIQQRPHKGLMGGLWEFPGGKLEKGESPEAALTREIHEELGVRVTPGEKLLTIRHTYTQFRVTLHVFPCKLEKGRLNPTQCEQWKWVLPEELDRYPFPAANVKIVAHLKNGGGPTRNGTS